MTEVDWPTFYAGTLTLASTLVAVLAAAVGLKRKPGNLTDFRVASVHASLAELAVAALVSVSQQAPNTVLVWLVPAASVLGALVFVGRHIDSWLVVRPQLQGSGYTWLDRFDGWFDLLPVSAYAAVILGTLGVVPAIAAALGVLWLTGSGLFQSVRYLGR